MDQAPDGKIVATGDKGPVDRVAVVRVTEEGEPDAGFSTVPSNGVRLIDIPGSTFENGLAVKVLGNGTSLVGGHGRNRGVPGRARCRRGTRLGVRDRRDRRPRPRHRRRTVRAKSSTSRRSQTGSILASGDALTAAGDEEGFVARFTPSGQLDPSFGDGGISHANPTSGDEELGSLEVDRIRPHRRRRDSRR